MFSRYALVERSEPAYHWRVPLSDPHPDRALPGWLRQALIVTGKDLRIEARTGEVTVTSAFFALLVVILSSLSFSGGPMNQRQVAAGTLWLTIAFAAVLALSRNWQREREESAFLGMLALPLSRSAIFFGKFLGLSIFLGIIEVMVIPLIALLFAIELSQTGLALISVALVATPGIAATGTLFGSMTVRTRARDLVLAVVLFPLLAPTLLAAVVATRELFGGVPIGELRDYLVLMGLFDFIFLVGGLTLFGLLVDE
ncbi:MAG TPA: heme exporter protein CcmB [Polyangiaceae bacterium]|nr:heme exporter protein CcmB [Polyangiaceae bacterium]